MPPPAPPPWGPAHSVARQHPAYVFNQWRGIGVGDTSPWSWKPKAKTTGRPAAGPLQVRAARRQLSKHNHRRNPHTGRSPAWHTQRQAKSAEKMPSEPRRRRNLKTKDARRAPLARPDRDSDLKTCDTMMASGPQRRGARPCHAVMAKAVTVKRRRGRRKRPHRHAAVKCDAPARSPQRRRAVQPPADPWPTVSTPC
jgi:hypothetical protein